MEEVSVYLFLGFLESGKTKFIQETLEDPRMETGENTLLLICEEGVEEYEPEKFAVKNVAVVTLESSDELNMENLEALTAKYNAQRIVVEYNGTWLLQQFFDAMPESWVINQMMTFFDANTFLNYNANMRQLVFDKVQMTQMVVFNRFKGEFEKIEFHKVVRGISRRPDIVYEYIGGKAEFDEIEDPLPFDVNAEIIEIEDRDFAWFYRDMAEKVQSYVGKKVRFKGMAAISKKVPSGYIVKGYKNTRLAYCYCENRIRIQFRLPRAGTCTYCRKAGTRRSSRRTGGDVLLKRFSRIFVFCAKQKLRDFKALSSGCDC